MIRTNPADKLLASISFFSLAPDDFKLRPFKGDFHTHCVQSGHGRLEAPLVAAHGRKIGLDFMALSEHRMTAPAKEARARLAAFDTGFEVIIAEEAHADRARPGGDR